MNSNHNNNFNQLALEIKQLGKDFGFNQVGITDTDLSLEAARFKTWLESGFNGNMKYFEKHFSLYEYPQKLFPATTRVICCQINYPGSQPDFHPIASFAKLQDYSIYIRDILTKFRDKISSKIKTTRDIKCYSGNAPILEKALAAKAGLGWQGKNSILINQNVGSYFFLGEILTDLSLPIDQPARNRCGNCFKCGASCPTKAIVAPYKIDARRCIAYLTVENKGPIPLELRPLVGNKIFGCDICQQVCPWNDQQQTQAKTSFTISPNFASESLIAWFLWDKKEFQDKTKNSPIGRISHECWLRNIAVALGNSSRDQKTSEALKSRLNHPSELVHEHVKWALQRQNK